MPVYYNTDPSLSAVCSVTLHDIVHTEKSLTLVFEYLERDLKQYMDECNNVLNPNNVRIFLFQLLRGLAYCHCRRILHRDLKPQNLLINDRGELKVQVCTFFL